MLNNINKFGFTLQDYLDYNGGIGSMMGAGGSMNFNANDMPVDFGQPVTGKVTSGALGLNYSVTPRDANRFNISYMGNGMKKLLDREVLSRNFTPAGNFDKNDRGQSDLKNMTNRLSSSWRNQIDSFHLLTMKAYGKLEDNKDIESGYSESYMGGALQNRLERNSNTAQLEAAIGASAALTKKMQSKWQLLQGKVSADYTHGSDMSKWENRTQYRDTNTVFNDAQYQNNYSRILKTAASLSVVRNLGKGYYLEPQLAGDFEKAVSNREQGIYNEQITDSLSPDFYRDVWSFSPGLLLRKNNKVLKWNIGLKGELTGIDPYLNKAAAANRQYQYLLPAAFLEWNIKSGERLSLRYNTDVTAPSAGQLMPYTNYNNPLTRTSGNINLRPEYSHNMNISYNNFDQFTMTSFFAFVNAKYTLNKIDWGRTVYADLSQDMKMINTRYAGQVMLNGQYSRPVRRLGMNVSISLNESWTRAVSPVNGIENTNNTWNHTLELELNNLNNEVWDLRGGLRANISNARYSLNKALNNNYYNYTGFASLAWQPNIHWYSSVSADITYYTAQSFDAPVSIPILKAEVSRYVLPNQRGTITLRGFDLLNRNKAVQRISQMNYLIEQRSNTIGRYVMLSFAYKLNRAGKQPGGIQIKNR